MLEMVFAFSPSSVDLFFFFGLFTTHSGMSNFSAKMNRDQTYLIQQWRTVCNFFVGNQLISRFARIFRTFSTSTTSIQWRTTILPIHCNRRINVIIYFGISSVRAGTTKKTHTAKHINFLKFERIQLKRQKVCFFFVHHQRLLLCLCVGVGAIDTVHVTMTWHLLHGKLYHGFYESDIPVSNIKYR